MAFHYCFTTCNNSFKLKVASFKPPKNVVITLIFFVLAVFFCRFERHRNQSRWSHRRLHWPSRSQLTCSMLITWTVLACSLMALSLSLSLSLYLASKDKRKLIDGAAEAASLQGEGAVCVCVSVSTHLRNHSFTSRTPGNQSCSKAVD